MKFETYQDVYNAIRVLPVNDGDSERLLEDYLASLLTLAAPLAHQTRMSLQTFYQLLSEAFVIPVPDTIPLPPESEHGFDENSFEYWHGAIYQQIVSLRALRTSDVLKDPLAVFGATSPIGETWYNTDPCGFLECASAALFGNDNEALDSMDMDWEEFHDFLDAGQYYE